MKKNKPTGWDYVIILAVFAITGSTAAYVGRLLMPGLGLDQLDGWAYWPLYILVITPIYQVLLLGYAFLFGKFTYFWEKQKKLGRWLAKPFRKTEGTGDGP